MVNPLGTYCFNSLNAAAGSPGRELSKEYKELEAFITNIDSYLGLIVAELQYANQQERSSCVLQVVDSFAKLKSQLSTLNQEDVKTQILEILQKLDSDIDATLCILRALHDEIGDSPRFLQNVFYEAQMAGVHAMNDSELQREFFIELAFFRARSENPEAAIEALNAADMLGCIDDNLKRKANYGFSCREIGFVLIRQGQYKNGMSVIDKIPNQNQRLRARNTIAHFLIENNRDPARGQAIFDANKDLSVNCLAEQYDLHMDLNELKGNLRKNSDDDCLFGRYRLGISLVEQGKYEDGMDVINQIRDQDQRLRALNVINQIRDQSQRLHPLNAINQTPDRGRGGFCILI